MAGSPYFSTTHHLVSDAQQGREGAFQELLERYFFVGRTWLESRRLPAGVSAGDVLGDVFLDFIAKPKILDRFEVRGAHSFRNFFFKVLKNRALYILRKSPPEVALGDAVETLGIDAEAPPSEEENLLWRMNLIRRALSEWMARRRADAGREKAAELFREIYLAGKGLKEAAKAVGLTIDQAKKAHARGKRDVKEIILELIRREVTDDAHYFEEIRNLFPLGGAPDAGRCPALETLRAFLRRALPEGEAKAVTAHLASCPYCPPRVRALGREEGAARDECP